MVKAILVDQSDGDFKEVDITLPSKELNKTASKVIKNSLVKEYFSEIPNKKTIKGFMFIELDDDSNVMVFGYSNMSSKYKEKINKFIFNEFINAAISKNKIKAQPQR